MSNVLSFLCLTLLLSVPGSHDAVMAVFHLSEEEGHFTLDVTFDIQDFLTTTDLAEEEVSLKVVDEYLSTTTSWKINDQEAVLQVLELKKDVDHYKVSCTMEKIPGAVQTLRIENQFFTHIPLHSNIIMIDLNGGFRDFRMHEERTMIEVRYNKY